jgi:peptidoglycan-N-acetylglucosamine deacetylase
VKSRIVIAVMIIAALALGLTAGCFYYSGLKQQHRLEQLEAQLAWEKSRSEALEAELKQLKQELLTLQELYDSLLKQDGHTGGNNPAPPPGQSPPVGSNPGGSGPTAYVTIDDGPSLHTLSILEILSRYRVPATFFVTGNNRSGDSGIYRRIAAEGHALANHTYTHNFDQIYLSTEKFMEDFLRLEDFLYRETGMRTKMMRFPGGTSSSMAQQVSGYNIMQDLIPLVKARGYDYFDWNVSSGDGDPSLPAPALIDNVKEQVERRGGDIVVLLHDGRNNQATVESLPQILEFLKARGYEFARLSPGAINVKHREY